ncbi:alpha/beta fold hydrolase [Candidatus Omnitrophota bacterium]
MKVSAKLTKFVCLDRGKDHSCLFVPGWATDYRIFSNLDLDFNYIYPEEFDPFSFKEDLLDYLKEKEIRKISLLGYSLGGFLAAEFACKNPGMIDQLILVSIRSSYKKSEIAQVKEYLTKSKRGFLLKFYQDCFVNRDDSKWFRENLLKEYCDKFSSEELLRGLDYLTQAKIDTEALKKINRLKIIHGESDKIAPAEEVYHLTEDLLKAEVVFMKDTGHMLFLKDEFKELI